MSFPKQVPAALREIRLHLCQTSPASQGVRAFILASYPAIKSSNPDLKFLIREASGVKARAFARFDRGVEAQANLDDLSEKDVAGTLARLVGSQGVSSS